MRPVAANAKFTEDTMQMRLGDDLWKTASKLRTYRIKTQKIPTLAAVMNRVAVVDEDLGIDADGSNVWMGLTYDQD